MLLTKGPDHLSVSSALWPLKTQYPEKVYISDFLALRRQLEEDKTTFRFSSVIQRKRVASCLPQAWLKSAGLKFRAKVLMSLKYIYETHQEG